jgi:FAD/FMN-containing dehydrogenase
MTADLDVFLADLAARGGKLEANGERLRIDAPAGVITARLRQALAEHKQAILGYLGSAGKRLEPEPPPVIHRIPLDNLAYGDFLARHKLRIVGGTAFPDGRHFRPTIYLVDDAG